MQLVIEVPDDSPLVEKINSWKDGSGYELNVVQTGVGEFTLSDASEEAQEEPGEDAPEAETAAETSAPSEESDMGNPAVKNLMASKRM